MKLFTWSLVGVLLAALLSGIVALEAFTVQKLWLWFVVPSFHINPLTLALAAGLGLLVSLMTYQTSAINWSEKTDKEKLNQLLIVIFNPLFFLGVGYLIHLFV